MGVNRERFQFLTLRLQLVIYLRLPVDFLGDYIKTDNNDTFPKICERLAIDKSQWRLYYAWLQKFFNYGHKHNEDHDGVYFKYPWKAQKGIKLQPR